MHWSYRRLALAIDFMIKETSIAYNFSIILLNGVLLRGIHFHYLMANIFFQLRVTVHDSGNPEQSATTVVRIPVTRNVNPPAFSQPTYEATINENIDVGLSILQASATDADGVKYFAPLWKSRFRTVDTVLIWLRVVHSFSEIVKLQD